MTKRRIIVVEDEGISAIMIRGILEKKGYAVTSTVFSGEETLKSAEEERPRSWYYKRSRGESYYRQR